MHKNIFITVAILLLVSLGLNVYLTVNYSVCLEQNRALNSTLTSVKSDLDSANNKITKLEAEKRTLERDKQQMISDNQQMAATIVALTQSQKDEPKDVILNAVLNALGMQ